mmetsp:Transcript_11984/g.34597  ORF Transcript_11984/g.34597 Transcript_11984/m.34597 type:complete len:229 (+) Transcript_11984:492-1178(+)
MPRIGKPPKLRPHFSPRHTCLLPCTAASVQPQRMPEIGYLSKPHPRSLPRRAWKKALSPRPQTGTQCPIPVPTNRISGLLTLARISSAKLSTSCACKKEAHARSRDDHHEDEEGTWPPFWPKPPETLLPQMAGWTSIFGGMLKRMNDRGGSCKCAWSTGHVGRVSRDPQRPEGTSRSDLTCARTASSTWGWGRRTPVALPSRNWPSGSTGRRCQVSYQVSPCEAPDYP